jgi:hypothetical protein
MSENAEAARSGPAYVLELSNTIERALPRLLALDDESTSRRSAPGKWSAREIVGHLLDSAANNHQRFVRAQLQDDLIFDGYAQDEWVRAQQYQQADWRELVHLWAAYNRHLARVMAAVPAGVRLRPRARHNLDRIGFRPFATGSPATLDDLMRDYVAHLQHHLAQLP